MISRCTPRRPAASHEHQVQFFCGCHPALNQMLIKHIHFELSFVFCHRAIVFHHVEVILQNCIHILLELIVCVNGIFLQDIFQVLDNNREIVSALVGPYGDIRFIQKVEVILARNSREVLEQMFPEKSDQMDYFYAYCLNGCLGFVKTWLADKKSCTPEFAADFIYRMVVSSMRAFCETREEV